MGASSPPVHAQKPPISSALGRVQQPGLSELPPTIRFIQTEPKRSSILCRLILGTSTAWVQTPATLVEFRGIQGLLCQGRWHPSLKPVIPESTSRR